MTTGAEYAAQLELMARVARIWLAAHPNAKIELVCHYPPEIFVSATISDALAKGVATCNHETRELIEAMPGYGTNWEPSVAMVRAVPESLGS